MGWHGIGRVELPELRRERGFVVVGRVSWDVSGRDSTPKVCCIGYCKSTWSWRDGSWTMEVLVEFEAMGLLDLLL